MTYVRVGLNYCRENHNKWFSRIIGSFFSAKPHWKSYLKTCIVTVEHYLTVLREEVVPRLNQSCDICNKLYAEWQNATPLKTIPIDYFWWRQTGQWRKLDRKASMINPSLLWSVSDLMAIWNHLCFVNSLQHFLNWKIAYVVMFHYFILTDCTQH